MPAIEFRLRVTLDDDETWVVVADQRDLAKYEAADFWAPDRPMTEARFLAWSASKRQGLTKMTWERWGDKCIEVVDPDFGEDRELDPTQPAQSGASS